MNLKIFILAEVFNYLDIPNEYKKIITIIKNNFDKEIKLISKTDYNILFILNKNGFLKYSEKLLKHGIITHYLLFENDFSKNYLESINTEDILDIRSSNISKTEFRFIIKKTETKISTVKSNITKEELISTKLKLEDFYYDQEIFSSIGKLLTKAEKDQNELLETILFLSRKITGADGGTIYLVEENKAAQKFLRFKYSHTRSKNVSYEESLIPLDRKSIAGYVALTGEAVNIENINHLDKKKFPSIKHNTAFDKINGYISRSILTVPMKNHLDKIIGVIQLINCKENFGPNSDTVHDSYDIKLESKKDFETKVFPFDKRYETLMQSVSSQAAIALENLFMVKQIQSQLDEFVKASIAAIEDRDPSTSGHSFRVASMCVELAKAVNSTKTGPFKDLIFSKIEVKEIEYASLLHDFGKVSLDFNVFLKEKKLYPKDFSFLLLKLDYLYQYLLTKQLEKNSSKPSVVLANEMFGADINADEKTAVKLKKIEEIRKMINVLNEPQIMEKDSKKILAKVSRELKEINCYDPYGKKIEIMNDDELLNLSIPKGTLNPQEKKQIEGHVELSYKFSKQIPWPLELKNIPEYIYKHHERIDGSGYPQKLKGKENIPVQSRMIMICDIYDALTAKDRPYKKAVPHDKVVQILNAEAAANKIDKDLFKIFLDNKVFVKNNFHFTN